MHSEVSQNQLVFTTAAAARVLQLLVEENNPTLNLRVYITGGGCSGFQYGFTFDEKVQAGDILITTDGANLVIDPMSFQYLQGAVVDYREGLEGSSFVVNNPNAKTTCGCGSSFTL
ncbi:MAG: iron-sulfur cluster insertion protein ErpA [Candidatus Symbiodolus clandestinus]